MNRQRRKDEKYSSYKASLAAEAKRLKSYLRGKLIWDSTHDGTFRRSVPKRDKYGRLT